MQLTYMVRAELELLDYDVTALNLAVEANRRVMGIKYLRSRFAISLVDAKKAFEAYEARCNQPWKMD